MSKIIFLIVIFYRKLLDLVIFMFYQLEKIALAKNKLYNFQCTGFI